MYAMENSTSLDMSSHTVTMMQSIMTKPIAAAAAASQSSTSTSTFSAASSLNQAAAASANGAVSIVGMLNYSVPMSQSAPASARASPTLPSVSERRSMHHPTTSARRKTGFQGLNTSVHISKSIIPDGRSSSPTLKRKSYSMSCVRDSYSTGKRSRHEHQSNGLSTRSKIIRILSEAPLPASKVSQLVSPEKKLESILSAKGISYTTKSFDSLHQFFQTTKQADVDSYDHDVLEAIRRADIDQLRAFHDQGRPLKCSNKFGESLLHLACRKGLSNVVDLLINELGVPVNVADDMGRNPLHDAFWTSEPNFDVVDLLVKKCPDLLFISDRRGHTPLSYARKSHWDRWTSFLDERSERVLEVTILSS